MPYHPVPLWQDVNQSTDARVEALIAAMTLEEKVAQLYGLWVGAADSSEDVAPYQHELCDPNLEWAKVITSGLGQLTRPFGTAPVDPSEGARSLARMQREVMAANRFGLPAQVHEECLTGFLTWQATVFPVPLAWGASFDPDLVRRAANQIGRALRLVGVHQGLSPVLDVTRDPRWGRTEETIGEDPYLVATVGTAYVQGLESAGVVATLKHFVGYSASRAGRNQAPASLGPREIAEVFLPPFEMAVREGGARSVMHSYAEVDGVPPAGDRRLLTDLLRTEWGFTGVVVADYFGISFLELTHHVAASPAHAARLALTAGVDVELPTVRCLGDELIASVRDGLLAEEVIDRALERVLRQKCELGLLDHDWTPEVDTEAIDLNPPEAQALARELAEESIVLLANDGVLPLSADGGQALPRVAVVGPLADDVNAMMGCYSFPRHVGQQHPDLDLGIAMPTVVEALRAEAPDLELVHVPGCQVAGTDLSGIPEAVEAARACDVCVAVLGDHAGLFGRGTSGEGCDVPDLALPGVQGDLLEALLGTGTPVVLVAMTGRPYALGGYAPRLAAAVQSFFPGQEGGTALAGVLTGRVSPSGRLPVGIPSGPGGQPSAYLAPPLGRRNGNTVVDPTALYPFGHGLSYTTFSWHSPTVEGRELGACPETVLVDTSGSVTVGLSVTNVGERAGTEVVQVYLHDPVATVTRPVVRLIGYSRVPLEPGQTGRVEFRFHADLASFVGLDGARVVEPGDLELRMSRSSAHLGQAIPIRLAGPERMVGQDRQMSMASTVLIDRASDR